MKGQPNILLILTDQQRRDSLASYGSTIRRTPATDRLAREGMLFSHAVTPTALCFPARASILTGLLFNHTMTNLTNTRIPSVGDLPTGLTTYSALLSEVDYRMAYVGKWHTGRTSFPLDFGFDDFRPGEGWHEWLPPNTVLENPSAVRLGHDHSKPMAARIPGSWPNRLGYYYTRGKCWQRPAVLSPVKLFRAPLSTLFTRTLPFDV